MTKSPVVSFGMICLATANKARLGQLKPWDVVSLQAAVLRELPMDTDVRRFVLAFGENARARDTRPAGDALLAAFHEWLQFQPPGPEEFSKQQDMFDWQKRADLQ